jgi:hypothetical protein
MFTRSQAKIYLQTQQEKVDKTINIIKQHLKVLETTTSCCSKNRIETINELYEYMLTDETKQTLLLPPFSSFRLCFIKKTNELKTELLVHIQKEKSVERQTKNLELLDNLIAMNCFLQEKQQEQEQQKQKQQEQQKQPRPPASARSPRKKVSTQVLLRRSARLMAKYA